jgi:hypothetical protein
MKSILKTVCGPPVLEVEYDLELLNWDEAIRVAYAAHGFRHWQVAVIAVPAANQKKSNGNDS